MTEKGDFLHDVREVALREKRYDTQAYLFVFEALDYTLKTIGKRRHVTGRELLEGIKSFALTNFGAMGRVVFNSWGLRETEDFGHIVFALVDANLMSKTETDSIEDFRGGFDFEEVFERGYRPELRGEDLREGGVSPENA